MMSYNFCVIVLKKLCGRFYNNALSFFFISVHLYDIRFCRASIMSSQCCAIVLKNYVNDFTTTL